MSFRPIRHWYIEVGKELDINFEPKDSAVSELIKMLVNDIYDYYIDGIRPDVAAELIAQRLGLKRKAFARN